MMRSKLGLASAEKEDEKLITDLLDWMHASQSDYTNTFRNLSNSTLISGELYASRNFQNWHSRWQDRLEKVEQQALAHPGVNWSDRIKFSIAAFGTEVQAAEGFRN